MISTLLSISQENPILFGIIILNIFIVLYITIYIGLYLYKRKHPEIILNILIWKTQIKRNQTCKTIEKLYELVMERLRKERIISTKDGIGHHARIKSLKHTNGTKKNILGEIYDIYEKKVYDNNQIENEESLVHNLLNRILSV